MATYVFVHGGGHGGWCYQRVARILRAAGHEVYTPTLTGLGERSHLLSPDIDLDHAHRRRRRGAVLRGPARRDPRRPQLRRHGDHRRRRPGRRPDRQAGVPRRRQPEERPVARRRRRADHRLGPPARRRWSTASRWCCSPSPRRALVLRGDRPRRPRLDGRAAHRAPVARASSRSSPDERGRAVGDPHATTIVCTSTLATRDRRADGRLRAEPAACGTSTPATT